MFARLLLRRSLQISASLPHVQSPLQHLVSCHNTTTATTTLLATRLPQNGSHRRWQHGDTTSATLEGSAPPVTATTDATMEDAAVAVGTDTPDPLFEEELAEKAFIAPSSTETLVFNGIPYNELPIVNIKATYNNTHVSVADHTGKTLTRTSCGTEGFKNAKKGTAIAAQTAGIAAATKSIDKGVKTVRVVIKGIGPGRQTSIKGLEMGGLDVVSITDNTPVPHNGCRPRKARRL